MKSESIVKNLYWDFGYILGTFRETGNQQKGYHHTCDHK